MKKLWLDTETRSRVNLKTQGAYVYAEHPSTELLIIGYAFDDEPVKLWYKGQKMPAPLIAALSNPFERVLIHAHNANFDRQVLGHTYKKLLDPKHWYCTMTQARSCALPGNLDDAAHMLGTHRKDKRGKELIRLLSIPQKDGNFNEDPALMKEFGAYCADDVRAMRALSQHLPAMNSDTLALYHASEIVNDRGMPIDTELCAAAVKYMEEAAKEAAIRIQLLTDGKVKSPRSVKLARFIYERMQEPHRHLIMVNRPQADNIVNQGCGHLAEPGHRSHKRNALGEHMVERLSLDIDARSRLLEAIEINSDQFDPLILHLLEAVEEAAVSSVAKFQTMLDRTSADGRLRGAFVMNGAVQTGRYSSKGAQTHNFPRLVAKDPDATRALIVSRKLQKDVLATLKSMLRPAIRPRDGYIVQSDWNAVEARGLPFLAGDPARDYLDAWRDPSRDLYQEQANAAGLTERQHGKVATLALGFGGGVNALLRMARSYGITIAHPDDVVYQWRRANPWAKQFWDALTFAAHSAMHNKGDGKWIPAGRVAMACNSFALMTCLPSGRILYYPMPEFARGEEEWMAPSITYAKAAWKPKKGVKEWPRAKLWHGILCENVTQAACADLLRHSITQAVQQGLPLVGHVHDELLAEVKSERAGREVAQAFSRAMLDVPAWAADLPLAVETHTRLCFSK
jgi:DNA polymerase